MFLLWESTMEIGNPYQMFLLLVHKSPLGRQIKDSKMSCPRVSGLYNSKEANII